MDALRQSILKKNATPLRLCIFWHCMKEFIQNTTFTLCFLMSQLYYGEVQTKELLFLSTEQSNELQEEKLPH